MNDQPNLERRLADFYAHEGLLRAPDRVLAKALSTIEDTPQRRVLGRLFGRVSWRYPDMNKFMGAAAAAAVLIVIVVVGYAFLSNRTPPPPAATPTPAPTAAPSASPTTSPAASPASSLALSPSPSGLALTESYTSAVHGISVSYPAGWQLQPATETWTDGGLGQDSQYADVIYKQQQDSPFIALASQPLNGKTPDQWTAAYLASFTGEDACAATEPYTIDGATGLVAHCGIGPTALVASGGRGYVIWLYRLDDYDWFKQIVSTVQLHPENAVAPSPSPSGLALTESYTSALHYMTVSYPTNWSVRPATEPWTTGGLSQESPYADIIFQQAVDTPFIALASQSLGGKTAKQWTDAFLASWTGEDACGATEPYTIDGIKGVVAQCGIGPNAVVVSRGRAYVIWAYRIDDLDSFKQIVDTVQLG